MRRAPRPGRRVRVEKWVAFPAWEITRIPKYYDERTRARVRDQGEVSKDHPRKIWVEEQDQFLIKNTKNVNQVWKHQQTITNYCLLCVITCVTLSISKASESSRSFIYGG